MANTNQVDTYKQLIADGIYKSFNLSLSSKDIEAQLQADQSFYKELLSVPARHLYNQILIDHCRELEDIFYDELTEVKMQQIQKREQNPDVASGSLIDQHLSQIEPKVKQYAEELTALENQHKNDSAKVRELNNQFINEWQQLQKDNARNISKALRDQGVALADDFEDRLYNRLDQLAADVDFSEETRKRFKIKADASPVKKAVIATLLEGEAV